jgi:TRAP-type C4-dicarboxylate transport system permease small subunit
MKLLDRLATASGVGAAVALLLIAVIILAQIAARLLGGQIPAADDFAAWAMAASAFLALPYALRHGDHIRVTLILHRLPAGAQRGAEVLATALGLGLAAWSAWYAGLFVFDSWRYDEVAQGVVRVPMWIPQLPMPLGLALLAALLAERLWKALSGQPLDSGTEDTARTE